MDIDEEKRLVDRIIQDGDLIDSYQKLPEKLKTESLSFVLVSEKPSLIKYVPEDSLSERIIIEAAIIEPQLLKAIPFFALTEEVCISLINEEWELIKYLPDSLRTEAVWKTAVETWPTSSRDEFTIINEIPYPELAKKACEKMIKADSLLALDIIEEVSIKYLPDHLIDDALNYNPEGFVSLPDEYKTPERCKNALAYNSYYFHNIPKDKLTNELCIYAVKADSNLIDLIPDELRNNEIWKAVLHERDGIGMDYLELLENILSPEDCLETFWQLARSSNEESPAAIIQHVPEQALTEDVILKAMDFDIDVFLYIPEESKTEKICKLAVRENATLLCNVPNEKLTEELIIDAVRFPDSNILEKIPDHLFTENVWKAAIPNWKFLNHSYLSFLKKIPSLEVFEQFYDVFKNQYKETAFSALRDLPDKFWTEQFADKVCFDGAGVLEHIPSRFITPERCKIIADYSEEFLHLIPVKMRTRELCEIAIRKSPSAVQYVPVELVKLPYLISMAKEDERILNYLPEFLDKKEIYREVVQSNIYALEYIPESYRTHEICELAIKKAFDIKPFPEQIFKYIPYTDLQIKTMRKVSDPDVALEIYFHIPNKQGNIDLLKEACKNNTDVVWYAPRVLVNQEICQMAIHNDPSVIQILPSELRTPELWLYVHKTAPGYPIPDEIQAGNNIFSFSKNLEKISKQELDIDTIKAMYCGLPFRVEELISGTENSQSSRIRWDKYENRFVPVPEPRQHKRENSKRMKP